MSKRYSGKSFKDSSFKKKPKLNFKEKRKLKRDKAKKKEITIFFQINLNILSDFLSFQKKNLMYKSQDL